jgi:glycosyltransferase involved in cell wall biosynthesis
VARLHRPGALLVVNSVRHLDLGRLHAIARRSGSRTVWYLREAASLVTLAKEDVQPDALIANSRPLAVQASEIWGRPCAYVPSVISREGLVDPATRDVLLAVNPIPSHGLDLLLALAPEIPDRRIALQESWPLSVRELRSLEASIDDLPNVELRRHAERSQVFRDAWALLLPHSGDQLGAARPRVALEAQLLGIPVLAHDISGLAAATASPELLVAEGAGLGAWVDAITELDRGYEVYSASARAFADREMPSARQVWQAFAAACPIELS